MATTTVKTGQAAPLEMPRGAALDLALTVTGFSITNLLLTFAIRSANPADPAVFKITSVSHAALIEDGGAGLITISIPPDTEDDDGVVLSDVATGMTRYRVDIGAPVEVRVQGNLYWIQEEGAWK